MIKLLIDSGIVVNVMKRPPLIKPRNDDGGLSADFAWLRNDNNNGHIIASPARYGIPPSDHADTILSEKQSAADPDYHRHQ